MLLTANCGSFCFWVGLMEKNNFPGLFWGVLMEDDWVEGCRYCRFSIWGLLAGKSGKVWSRSGNVLS